MTGWTVTNVPRFAVWCFVRLSSRLGPNPGDQCACREMTTASSLGSDHVAATQRFSSRPRFHPVNHPTVGHSLIHGVVESIFMHLNGRCLRILSKRSRQGNAKSARLEKKSESHWECEKHAATFHLPECFKILHCVKMSLTSKNVTESTGYF